MAKDILKVKVFKDVLARAIDMIKFFKNKHQLNYRLSEAQRSANGTAFMLETPVKTRWMSHHNALNSLIKSKTPLQQVVIAEDFYEVAGTSRGTEFKKDILDDEFWAKVTEVRAILEPISTAIIHLEGDKGALSAVVPNFTDIMNFYESSSLPNKEVGLLMVHYLRPISERNQVQ